MLALLVNFVIVFLCHVGVEQIKHNTGNGFNATYDYSTIRIPVRSAFCRHELYSISIVCLGKMPATALQPILRFPEMMKWYVCVLAITRTPSTGHFRVAYGFHGILAPWSKITRLNNAIQHPGHIHLMVITCGASSDIEQ